jgi:hypothetical protein
MDVWNLSLDGHLELTGDSGGINGETKLFNLYKGKTIVMLGDAFPCFERGQRTVSDLIDHKDFAAAALMGTNMFISGTMLNKSGIKNLGRHLCATDKTGGQVSISKTTDDAPILDTQLERVCFVT